MIDLLPDAPDPANDIPAVFNQKAAALVLAQKAMVPQLNAAIGNMNSVAAGGAYAIPFRFTNNSANVSTGTWLALLSATSITFDSKDARYADTTAQLSNLLSTSTSAVKAQMRIYAQGDPSRWFVYNVTAYTQYAAYGNATVQIVASSGTFGEGESVVVLFTRNGDKGDSGSITPVLWVRDEKTSGTSGGAGGAATYVARTLNTIKKNSIANASVSSNQITLPAGTYRFDITAPGYGVSHQAYLYNVTDAATQITGSSGANSGASASVINNSEITIAAAKVFEIRHYTASNVANGLGQAASTGQGEVYTEVFIEKVS